MWIGSETISFIINVSREGDKFPVYVPGSTSTTHVPVATACVEVRIAMFLLIVWHGTPNDLHSIIGAIIVKPWVTPTPRMLRVVTRFRVCLCDIDRKRQPIGHAIKVDIIGRRQ